MTLLSATWEALGPELVLNINLVSNWPYELCDSLEFGAVSYRNGAGIPMTGVGQLIREYNNNIAKFLI